MVEQPDEVREQPEEQAPEEDDSQTETGIEVRLELPSRRIALQAGGRTLEINSTGDALADVVAAVQTLWPLTDDPRALRAAERGREPMGFVSLGSDTDLAGGDEDEEARAAA